MTYFFTEKNYGTQRYGEMSTRKAKEFVLRCHNLVSKSNMMWISFQPNSVADVVNDDGSFKDAFAEMK